jgi:apolipoprotein N-acyltransferase
VVVWPETALPYVVDEDTAYVVDLAKRAGVTILVGAFTVDEDGQYNSIACFLPDGSMHETVYAKRRLVPFGEFVPMRGLIETLIPPLADLVMSGEDVAWGEGANVFDLEQGSIGSLICFDSIYEDLTRESVRDGAELICLSTNDSWFTDSAALYMHNAQAQMRAIENGRWIVRAANTGISTVISSRGEVLCGLEPLVDGMVIYDVPVNTHTTLYTVTGNLVVYFGILALVLLAVYEINVKIRKKY